MDTSHLLIRLRYQSRVTNLRRLEEGLALLPVARAQLVRLQRIEHAQHLFRVAAYAHVVDGNEADDALRVDDESGAQRDPFLLVQDAEPLRQLTLDVGQHGEGQVLQIGMRAAPREVNEL